MHAGLRLALLKPAALPVTPPSDPPSSLLLLRCILCLVFVILFKLFIAWQCSLVTSWCTLCVGTSLLSKGVMVYCYNNYHSFYTFYTRSLAVARFDWWLLSVNPEPFFVSLRLPPCLLFSSSRPLLLPFRYFPFFQRSREFAISP